MGKKRLNSSPLIQTNLLHTTNSPHIQYLRTDFKCLHLTRKHSLCFTLLNHIIFTLPSQQNHYELPQAAHMLAQTRFNKQIMHPVSLDWDVIPKVCSKSRSGWVFLACCTLVCTLKFLKLCKNWWETQVLKIRVRRALYLCLNTCDWSCNSILGAYVIGAVVWRAGTRSRSTVACRV